MTLYVGIRDGRIEDIAFQCACCGISMASASIMTELLKEHRDAVDARDQVRAFVAWLDDRAALPRPTREQVGCREYASAGRCGRRKLRLAIRWSAVATGRLVALLARIVARAL